MEGGPDKRTPEQQAVLRLAVQALVKYRSTTRLYGAGHVFADRFLLSFTDRMVELVGMAGATSVTVNPHGFFFGDEPILRGDAHDAMTFALYNEGLRILVFRPGINRIELRGLADVLIFPWELATVGDEDLTSALWRLDLKNVEVLVAERFGEEMGEGGDAAYREDLALGRERGARRGKAEGDSLFVDEMAEQMERLEAEAEAANSPLMMKQDEAELLLRFRDKLNFEAEGLAPVHELLEVPRREHVRIEVEVESVHAAADVGVDDLGVVIFEMVRNGRETEGQRRVGDLLAGHAILLVEASRMAEGAALVRRCTAFRSRSFPGVIGDQAFLDGYDSLVTTQAPRLAAALGAYGEPEVHARYLFTMLNLVQKRRGDDVRAFLKRLSHVAFQQVVADLLVLWGQVDEHAMVEEAKGPANEDRLLPLLVLGRLRSPLVREHAMRLLDAEDGRIREAALRALRGRQDARLKQAVVQALADDNKGVRVEGLRHAAVIRDKGLADQVAAGIRLELLRPHDPDEIRAWCAAYAFASRARAFGPLSHLLLDERNAPDDDLPVRAGAARALPITGAPDVHISLDKARRRFEGLDALLGDPQ
jgi:hypothetical protein